MRAIEAKKTALTEHPAEAVRSQAGDTAEVGLARAASASRRLSVAYLVTYYPTVSHTFIRREIAAVENSGAIEVQRYALRAGPHGFVDPADCEEARKTRILLDVGPFGMAQATLLALLDAPRRFFGALILALRVGWRSHRGLLVHLIYLAEACVLLRALRASGVGHIHAHFGTNAAAIAMLCRSLGGPPYSFTVHGPLEFELAPLLGLREKVARAQFVVAISDFCRSQVWRHCDPKDQHKVHVVTCGVDSGFLAEEPTPVPRAPKLVFVGRLSSHKAPAMLLDAAKQLKGERITFELTFVGDGELRPELEAAIVSSGLSGCVRVTGFSDESMVRKHIREARALVLPSLSEGLPVVLMEALALGRPAVSTFVAGIPELIEPGKSGWLVPASSLDRLTDALREVLAAPVEQLERMGRAGRARVLERYDARNSGRALARLFAGSSG